MAVPARRAFGRPFGTGSRPAQRRLFHRSERGEASRAVSAPGAHDHGHRRTGGPNGPNDAAGTFSGLDSEFPPWVSEVLV